MYRPFREHAPVPPPPPPTLQPIRHGLPFPGGSPLVPAAMMNTAQRGSAGQGMVNTAQGINSGQGMMSSAQGMSSGNMPLQGPLPQLPAPPFVPTGRAVLLPSFRGSLPGFPPLPTAPRPPSPPPLPPSPPAEVPPPPPLPDDDNSVSDIAVPPRMPQDPEVVKNIEILVGFVARNGLQFEQMTKSKQGADPKFAFLFGGEPGSEAAVGYQFYEWKKRAILRKQGKELNQCTENSSAEQAKTDNISPHPKHLEPTPVSPAGSDMDMEDDFAAPHLLAQPRSAQDSSREDKSLFSPKVKRPSSPETSAILLCATSLIHPEVLRLHCIARIICTMC